MNIVTKTKNYFLESYAEIRKVIWPGRKQTIDYTILVIVLSVGVAVFFGILDYLFSSGLALLIK